MKKLFFIFLVISVLSYACKKKEVPPVDEYTAEEQARDGLFDLMNEWYLWYKLMPVVVPEDYKDPYELMDAMRYQTLDRWSFVADYNAFIASMQGSFVGHGIRIGLDETLKARIVMIYANSPLYSKGVRRGWIIKKINGTDLAPILAAGDAAAYYQLIGASQAGITNTFLFQTPEGKDSTISSTKASFTVNSVLNYEILNLQSGVTAHLVFNEFIEPSTQELQTAFAYFKENNAKDLILDLRYNSGGILDVATDLASYIAGTSKFSTPFIRSDYNDKKASDNNKTTNFKTVASPLNLTRLVVICTRETASASEVVINGLKPHMNVICLGDTTDGKPTGMNVWRYATMYVFAPVTFSLVNSAGQGDFYDGFAPAKYVTDDIAHDFIDKNESCLKEAIHYLETGSVSTKREYIYRPSVQFSEKPSWMNNMFILN